MGNKYYQGYFKPKNPDKYIGNHNNIIYRSMWELKFMKWCDTNSNILKYGSEEIAISYFDTTTKKIRRYFPDFMMIVKDANENIKKYIVEVKPSKQTKLPKAQKRKTKNWLYESLMFERNTCKWEAAKKFCEKHGYEFTIITEHELNIKY